MSKIGRAFGGLTRFNDVLNRFNDVLNPMEYLKAKRNSLARVERERERDSWNSAKIGRTQFLSEHDV